MTGKRRKLNNKLWHLPKSLSFFGLGLPGFIGLIFQRVATDKVSVLALKVLRGHRGGLFVEGVAVDTDGGEAALEPVAGVNKPPAAESAAMEQERLSQAKQT